MVIPGSSQVMGAVLAGGQSRRFGSDKALALLDGRTLLDHAVAGLRAICAEVAVIGRGEVPAGTLYGRDRPGPGLGPLGGIAGALHLARERGFAAVLTVPVDAGPVDAGPVDAGAFAADMLGLLTPAPACCEDQPVIGLWPVAALEAVDGILAGDGRHSVLALAEALGARMVRLLVPLANINTPADLAALERRA
jgi:molybdopterin-guanine dinucleotide biosynthesis protein A